ncbi:3-deoxy-7-phosphoheptulonate synthase [Thiohalorhabdus methylotrophus]|uniref:3-deoxy-7-phosphoheptulonate synthase n=1 Tax=Thiohalorhabdus methylotrophus TaxID=3242694 RepID=A0ABV4TQ30_9GAMM
MIVILKTGVDEKDPEYQSLLTYLAAKPDIEVRHHREHGTRETVTELYLIGDTSALDADEIAGEPAVERVVRVSDRYRLLGRHRGQVEPVGFDYNGLHFGQDTFHLFAGLCAVDNRTNTERMMAALRDHGLVTTRMGAYKPRTSPYDFQGHGADCLPYVFELAGNYGIRVVTMEVTQAEQIEEIRDNLERAGNPTGVMLQVGTRNAQNFELLKEVGAQNRFPVLYKRGFGISLEESLNACEYIAASGNRNIVFCLRGVKSHMGAPHRNLVDFAHVPVVKRLTRMPVCVDPSHSVGSRERAPDGLLEIQHVAAQGVIAGANMVLTDFHPEPERALVDGPQALHLEELPYFSRDLAMVEEAYRNRVHLAANMPRF